MVATSIEAVKAAVAQDDTLAATFGRKFIASYAATAFGVLPKTEIDLLVFSLLVEAAVIDPNGSIFRMARALNVTPTKAKAMLFQHQLRTVSEEDADHAVMIALTTAKYRKEGEKLAFGVHSPLIYAAIRAKMQDGGVFADVNLSGDILTVSPDQFGQVIASLVTPKQAAQLIKRLRKTKVVNETQLRAAIEKLGTKAAIEAIKECGKAAAKHGFTALSGLLNGADGDGFDNLIDALG